MEEGAMESAVREPIRQPISAEEEAVKMNTDCIYFLASPLTCKKGSECEYRHSEGARINPRDCWFWLNGNCLNSKCSFRHPPLDGLLGTSTPTATASGHSLPSVQTAVSAQVPAAYAPSAYTPNKQSVPCYFFQKGGCLKGDRCPFMHGPQPVNSSIPQQAGKVATPSTEISNASKNPSWTLEKCTQQNRPEISADKPVEVPQSWVKPNAKAEITPANGLTVKSNIIPTPLVDEMAHRFQPNSVTHNVSNSADGPQDYHLQPVDECIQNGREPDDSLRESSPGFDVLVDDECEDTEYFHKDDEFGGASDYGGKNPNLVNDFDYLHSADYDSVSKFEREIYNEIGEHDRHGRRDWYHREHHRSSERTMKRSAMSERRGTWRENSPDKLAASDLRHRLLKQRRLNGPRSAISPDNHDESYRRDDQYVEEQRYRSRSSRRDQHNLPHESSISNRLQGRITLPGRASDTYNNLHSEGVIDRGRNWGRSSSPGQPLSSQGRHHDTVKQRANKDLTAEARNLGGHPRRRDEIESLNFAGPKSLAELKGAKFSGKSEVTSTRIDNCAVPNEYEKLEGSRSFEGPKPLNVILKRKRETTPGNDAVSSNGHEDNQRVTEEHEDGHMATAVTDTKTIQPVESDNGKSQSTIEIPKSTATVDDDDEEEGLIVSDGEELAYEGQSSPKERMLDMEDGKQVDDMGDLPEVKEGGRNGDSKCEDADGTDSKVEDGEGLPDPDQPLHKEGLLKTEDGMLVDDVESPELQNYDQRDEDFEYETTDGTNFNTEDGEYAYEEEEEEEDEEDLDDEDGDDFARKLGAMLS